MRVLHDIPSVDGGCDHNSSVGTVGAPLLDASLLRESSGSRSQPSRSIEELSRIWTVAAGRRPSALRGLRALARPDRESTHSTAIRTGPTPDGIHTTLSQRPLITSVYRMRHRAILSGYLRVEVLGELTIEGLNFSAVTTFVSLGGRPPVAVVPVSDRIIRVTVPDDPQ